LECYRHKKTSSTSTGSAFDVIVNTKVVRIRAALIVVMVAAVLMFLQSQGRAPKAGSAPLTLCLDGPFNPAHAGALVALSKGIFARQGLDLQIRAAGDSLARVTSGEDTIGLASAESFLIAREKGAPVLAFAGGLLETPVVFVALESARIHTVADLPGKRVGVAPGETSEIIYRALLARAQVSPNKIEEIIGAELDALLAGVVDLVPGTAATLFSLKQRGIAFTTIKPPNYGIHVPGTVYFVQEQTVRSRPALIRDFLKGLLAGWDTAYGDLDAAAKALLALASDGLTHDGVLYILSQQRELLRPPARRIAEFDLVQWRALRDILLRQKLLRHPVDLSNAVSLAFLEDVYRKPLTFGR
jgi:ABC-type nitrate/sulfonate/bicarbonate transport system substrate-binding protein